MPSKQLSQTQKGAGWTRVDTKDERQRKAAIKGKTDAAFEELVRSGRATQPDVWGAMSDASKARVTVIAARVAEEQAAERAAERARLQKAGACFRCGDVGHVGKDCPSGACHRCGDKGHKIKDCMVRVKAPAPKGRDQGAKGGAKGACALRCYRCGQDGHLVRQCHELEQMTREQWEALPGETKAVMAAKAAQVAADKDARATAARQATRVSHTPAGPCTGPVLAA